MAEFEGLARFAPKDVHDSFSQRNLHRVLFQFSQRTPPHLARLRWDADGQPVASLAQLLARPTFPASTRVTVLDPVKEPGPWEFSMPTAGMVFDPGGAGKIVTVPFNPHSLAPWDVTDPGREESCVIRFACRESFVPRSIRQQNAARDGDPPRPPPFELFTPKELAHFVQTTGVVPLQVALLAYTSKTRYRYEVDLIKNMILRDPRAGQLTLEDFVPRSARLAHGLDRFVARGELPLLPRRVLETLFESKGLEVNDIAVSLDVAPELAQAALETLVARKFAEHDSRTGGYLPLPQVFLTRAEVERERADEEARRAKQSVGLRESVEVLFNQIEAHPACPLCGREIEVGAKELLCSRCQEDVQAGP